MTKKNETTSKRIAAKAGKFLARCEYRHCDIDKMIAEHESSIAVLKLMKKEFDDMRSIAASVLTQAEDRG